MNRKSIDVSSTKRWYRNGVMLVVACFAVGTACAEFKVDRSVMSDAYWKIWNDQAQAKIDADIEKYRKADGSFEIAAPDGAEVTVEQNTHSFFFGAPSMSAKRISVILSVAGFILLMFMD